MSMIRALYDWVIQLAETRYALLALAVVSFVESSFFPIPPDVLMIPMILAAPHRAFLIAGVCMVSSVAGGALGYYIGAELYELIGKPVLEFYGKEDNFIDLVERYQENGFWAVFIAGFTPFPYKVITIFSGVSQLDFWLFMGTSVLARGARFFLVAILLWKYGEAIREFIEKRLGLVTIVATALLIGGFVLLRYL